ncbi:MAG: FKBP-type peptidyl-prolyl cis-trans isomerase [Phycisphaeraceae bacterium]|nr:FKBP-type peptidyl-prolyl cis-trans isomerase [Phycisphaeraceae bacterium]MCB9848735.1 FKBP-type peptidyl-prolyl cis-trans isomerase [Phycisphaeraceae bacterium]
MTNGRFPRFLIGAAAAAALAGAAIADTDLTKLPPDPAEVCGVLNHCSFSIIEAAIKAEKETGGRLNSIEMIHSDGPAVFRAVCYTESDEITVVMDSKTGDVISMAKADTTLPGDGIDGLELHKSDSGLMWYDLVEGDGPSPASPASSVVVHYTGWLVDGTKFDSSVDRGKTIEFPLNRVIPGWTEGVGSMKVGGKRKLLIPSKIAYGPSGRPPVIPPDAFLIFDVELFEVKD